MPLSLGQNHPSQHSIRTCCDSCFNKRCNLQSSSNEKIYSTLLSTGDREETSQTSTKRSREDFELNKKEDKRYLIATTRFPSLSSSMTLTANKVSTPGLSMQELIRQRVGLCLSKPQPTTTVSIDYSEEDDEEENETHHVCKCCRKCEEFVPKRTPISKGPNLSNNNNKKKNHNNNTSKGRFNAKRKLQNSQEEEEEEEEDSPTGTICANCGCTLIHHLVDDWEAENDARDEDYLAEYGEYDD